MHRAAGFTMIEVLVALVIASLALGVLFSGALTGLRSATLSNDYQQATWRARSHLAALAAPGALVPGTQSGNDGSGFTWSTRIAAIANAPPAVLYAVSVTIFWTKDGGRRQVTLASERLGALPAKTP